MKENFQILMDMDYTGYDFNFADYPEIDSSEKSQSLNIAAAIIKKASSGDVKAFNAIIKIMGTDKDNTKNTEE